MRELRMKDAQETTPPFDMGISDFKKMVRSNPNLSKGDKSKAIAAYKKRVYERVAEVREKFEEVRMLETDGKPTQSKE